MPDTVLRLGDFQFRATEIPERISFGGAQQLVVHKLIGGVRVIDAMGRDDAPVTWSGLFQGPDSVTRAQFLDTLRVQGGVQFLSYYTLGADVVVKSFSADFERFYQVPYTITVEIVRDYSTPVTELPDGAGIDDAITGDMAAATVMGGQIGDSTLTGLLGTLNTAISNVSTFANAAQSTLNSVLQPIANVSARVQVLITSTSAVLTNVATVGGLAPNTGIAQAVASLNGQVAAMTQSPVLYNLSSVLGRMNANLSNLGNSGQSVTKAGGNLYSLAAAAYSDASSWTTLARANGLTDPALQGVNTIRIPPLPDGAGGVLNS